MNPVSILIVEDELLLAEVMRAELSNCGYEVLGIETTGESTLSRMAELTANGESPDIVLTDIKLSGKIDGIQTAEEINKQYRSAVIFLTGFYDPEIFERSIATKPYAYLLKPFDVQQAEATIRIALYQRQLELDLQAHQTELETLNRQLEQHVQERTIDLDASRERNQALLEAIPDAIYLTDKDGVILDGKAPTDYEPLYTPKQLIRKNLDHMPPIKVAQEIVAHVKQVIKTGYAPVLECQILVNGKMQHRELRFAAINKDQAIFIVRDITERKQTEADLKRYTERLEIMRDIDIAILAVLSPQDIAQVALERIHELLPCHQANVLLFDFHANEALVLASKSNDKAIITQGQKVKFADMPDRSLVINYLKQGIVFSVEDINPLTLTPFDQYLLIGDVRSVISIPLICHGELIGALTLGADFPHAYDQEQLAIAHQLTDSLAIAIEQGRLFEQTHNFMETLEKRVADRTRELSMLYNVSAICSKSLDLETTMTQALALLLPAMQCKTGIIHLVEQDEPQVTLRMITQRGFESKILDQFSSPPCKEALWSWVANHKQPLIIADLLDNTPTDQPLFTFLKDSSVNIYLGVPILSKNQLTGVLSIFRNTPQQFTSEEAALLATVADQLGVVLERDHLRQMAEQAVVTEERQRLARDLHDSVTQALYSLTLFSEASQEYIKNGQLERVQQLDERISFTAQQALREMRLLIYELRPSVLESEGLTRALQLRLDAVEHQVGLNAQLVVDMSVDLPAIMAEELYRITQEALNNILKHAAAKKVTVHLHSNLKQVELRIVDDGKGFNPELIDEHGGMGLNNMRERVEKLGGLLTIVSAPGEGTTVTCVIKSSNAP
jgi:signal transduction histidine kinase/DNA-binding NarL/FixJ family response regulator